MHDRKRYPIGIQTFSVIREGNCQYVDKTQYVYGLAEKYKYVFLSRPRRFGKSLLVSTFESYFRGEKALFDGLKIAELEKDWTEYPVLHFDISTAKHVDRDGLITELEGKLADYEEIYGRKPSDININQRLEGLIKSAYRQTGRRAVVLIDEYDAPLLDVLDDNERLEANRQVMRNFYSPLKACDRYLRFVFITGITKFSQLSIFSELNNLKNISLMPEYAAVCGISVEELSTQFGEDVDDMAAKLGTSRDETIKSLRDFYDGYRFASESPDIFNPFSLINALDSKRIESYWFSSGTPTYLLRQMRRFGVKPQDICPLTTTSDEFDAPTENMKSITPLLYQSGYLTIKAYDRELDAYDLDIPNREVRSGLMTSMIPYLDNDYETTPAFRLIIAMQKSFIHDKIDEVMEGLRVFFSSIPHTDNIAKDYEGHYQSLLFVVFSMMCRYVDVEVRTPRGRADMIMNARNKIYIIEVKLNKSAESALKQIDLRQYGERFLIEGKPIVRVGVNFDAEKGNISD